MEGASTIEPAPAAGPEGRARSGPAGDSPPQRPGEPRVYRATAESWRRSSTRTLLRSYLRHASLIRAFVARDLRARYVASAMGFFWSVLYPAIAFLLYTFVFWVILKMRWADKMGNREVPLFIFAGMLPWLTFQETISRCTNVVIENAQLIKKVAFPQEILCLNLTLSGVVNQLFGMGVLLLAMVVLGAYPTIWWLFLPVLLLLQVVFTVGLGYLFAAVNVYFRDAFHVVGVLLTVWMFTTPIFYPDSMVLEKGFGLMLIVNPMYWLIEAYRAVLVGVPGTTGSLVPFGPDFGDSAAAAHYWAAKASRALAVGTPIPEASLPPVSASGAQLIILARLILFAAVAAAVFWLGARVFEKRKGDFPDLI